VPYNSSLSDYESDPAMFKSMSINQRCGFTIVELLVVITIIGVLTALLLPAVQAAREAARRAQCMNNLKQLGLAALQFHDQQRHLPPGIGYYPTANHGVFGTGFFHLLPYLEEGNLFDRSLGSVPFPPPVGPSVVRYPGNNNVYRQTAAVFLCPTDPSVEPGGVVTVDEVTWGASSYASSALASAVYDLTVNPPTSDPQGRVRIPADFADGTSHTILHAEKYARCTNSNMAPPFQDGGNAWAFCTSAVFPWQPPPMSFPGKALLPGFAIPGLAGRGAPNVIGPNSIFQVDPTPFLGNCDPTRASTAHTSGIAVGLADGSARNLSPSISGDTWWAAVTPKGEEMQGADW
jgi:prepilin-type N-terminal cleavage/methylation domain-containing protein